MGTESDSQALLKTPSQAEKEHIPTRSPLSLPLLPGITALTSDVPSVVEVCPLTHNWGEATPALNPSLPIPNLLDWLWVVNSSVLHYFWGLKDY